MKTYKLRILYPSIFDIAVDASSLEVANQGCYIFYDKDMYIIASYPISYTIIKSIEKA